MAGIKLPHEIVRFAIIATVLVSSLSVGHAAARSGNVANDPSGHKALTVANQPLNAALKQLSQRYGYQIQIDEQYHAIPVTFTIKDVSLDKAIKELLWALKNPNHIILTDDEKKIVEIKLYNFEPKGLKTQGHSTPAVQDENIDDLAYIVGDDQLTTLKRAHEAKSASPEDVVSPPSRDGRPGMSLAELEHLKAQHDDRQRLKGQDTIVSPPPADAQPKDADLPGQDEAADASDQEIEKAGLSAQELEALKIDYRRKQEQMSGETVISPSSPDGQGGMTAAELESLKQRHRQRKQQIAGDTMVSPPSPDGRPGMTLQELEALKATRK